MRTRCSSRLLIINSLNQVLLFRFHHKNDALAGQVYWATPGGGVEPEETFKQAATRELREETGIDVDEVGEAVAERFFEMTLPSGEVVIAHEKFYVIRVDNKKIITSGWTQNERIVMGNYLWWDLEALRNTREVVFPENIPDIFNG